MILGRCFVNVASLVSFVRCDDHNVCIYIASSGVPVDTLLLAMHSSH